MAIGTLDLALCRGISYLDSWQFLASDGEPLDLTGYAAYLQVRAQPGPGAVEWFSLSTALNDGIVIDGLNGTLDINIAPAKTAAAPRNGSGAYDLILVPPAPADTERLRWLQGRVFMSDPVTVVAP